MAIDIKLNSINILNDGEVLTEDAIEILEDDIKTIAAKASTFEPPKNGSTGSVLTKTKDGISWELVTLDNFDCYTKSDIISMIGPNNVASNIKFNTEKSVVSALNTLYDLYNRLDGDTNAELSDLNDRLDQVIASVAENIKNIDLNKTNIGKNTQDIKNLSDSLNNFLNSNNSSLNSLLSEIETIKNKNNEQDGKISNLENTLKDVDSDINNLDTRLTQINSNLSSEITKFKEDNNNQHVAIDERINSVRDELLNAISNNAGGGNQTGFDNLLSKIDEINDDITNNIKPDIENLKERVLVNEQNINSLLARVTKAEDRLNQHDTNIDNMNSNIGKIQQDIERLANRVTNTENGILLNLANGDKQGTLIQRDYEDPTLLNNNADGVNSIVFGTNNIMHTEYGFAIGKYCNHLEDQENNPIFFVGNGTSGNLLNLLSMSVENTYLHSNNIIIDNNLNVANASINELTSYKIIIPSEDSSSNSCELCVAGVFKDSKGNLGNISTILSSDSTGRPVWKTINLDLISDGGIDYVGRFFNTNANQPPIDTIIDITQGEIFNDYVNNKAPGDYSHAEGCSSYAIGTASHASGNNSAAVGDVCFAHGWNIIAGKTVNSDYGNYDYNNGADANISSDNKFNQQFIVGRNNVCNQNTIFAVGCGASSTSRKNVFEATSSGINVDGTIVSTGDITSPNITDIDNRLTNLINEYNGDTSGKLNNIQFDGKNLLIDGYIKDINGVNPKNDQILSWDEVNGNLKWINCTAVESDKFKITETINSWYNTTVSGVQVYSKDIKHNFKDKNGDTFTDPRSIEVIAYNSENIRVYLSYKVYTDDLNKITVYSPVNDNIFIIVKQI